MHMCASACHPPLTRASFFLGTMTRLTVLLTPLSVVLPPALLLLVALVSLEVEDEGACSEPTSSPSPPASLSSSLSVFSAASSCWAINMVHDTWLLGGPSGPGV